MLLPLIIGAILVFVAFTFGRPYVMQFLASVPVPEEHRRLFSAVSYGFIFTVSGNFVDLHARRHRRLLALQLRAGVGSAVGVRIHLADEPLIVR